MEQFKAMLLAGAYSDYVTSLTVLKHAMGPAGAGIILTTTWHTPEPPAVAAVRVEQGGQEPAGRTPSATTCASKGIPCIAGGTRAGCAPS